jgi:hypothetical protein
LSPTYSQHSVGAMPETILAQDIEAPAVIAGQCPDMTLAHHSTPTGQPQPEFFLRKCLIIPANTLYSLGGRQCGPLERRAAVMVKAKHARSPAAPHVRVPRIAMI